MAINLFSALEGRPRTQWAISSLNKFACAPNRGTVSKGGCPSGAGVVGGFVSWGWRSARPRLYSAAALRLRQIGNRLTVLADFCRFASQLYRGQLSNGELPYCLILLNDIVSPLQGLGFCHVRNLPLG